MQPKFLIVGQVTNDPVPTQSKLNKIYLNVELQVKWSFIQNQETVEKIDRYDVCFFGQKATNCAIRRGDIVQIEGNISSTLRENTTNGGHFVSLSLMGQNYEVLHASPMQQQRPQQPQQQRPQQQRQTNPYSANLPLADFNAEDLPF